MNPALIGLSTFNFISTYAEEGGDLQLLDKEVKGILLYQGFPKPILPTKHLKPREGCFAGKIHRENPGLCKIL